MICTIIGGVERLIFVDSDITRFENITIEEYKQKEGN